MYDHEVSILSKLQSFQSQSLANGLKLRNMMHAQIDQGLEVEGYRPDWIKETVIMLFAVLESQCAAFNDAYSCKMDRTSSKDVEDCLTSALASLAVDRG